MLFHWGQMATGDDDAGLHAERTHTPALDEVCEVDDILCFFLKFYLFWDSCSVQKKMGLSSACASQWCFSCHKH